MQKAIVCNPVFGGVSTIDASDLNTALADGWKVNTTAESSNGAILVVVEKDEPEKET